MEYRIEELTCFVEQDYADLCGLLAQLTPGASLTRDGLDDVLADDNVHLFVMRDADGRIIATATLCVCHALSATKAAIEDVVVDDRHRGCHLGRQLMQHILRVAPSFAPEKICLTSRPQRIAANRLYQSLGFQRRDTNSYQMAVRRRDEADDEKG